MRATRCSQDLRNTLNKFLYGYYLTVQFCNLLGCLTQALELLRRVH